MLLNNKLENIVELLPITSTTTTTTTTTSTTSTSTTTTTKKYDRGAKGMKRGFQINSSLGSW
ncbi:hypothetical protein RH915_02720 [Serpentinicella sp. ANB-PHB4]|uniref:hypothetical protein n=1 Tax=Serpentinicella sp. ANB-PHB4 TaxID=3074076 RepID=UPI00285BB5F6|nr:hypothetical protein [Serpentinicella sp. ANB-PHB4]MDR5658395.1 hypothetical protein [Serpentinicella sp. ANB-PHB4]